MSLDVTLPGVSRVAWIALLLAAHLSGSPLAAQSAAVESDDMSRAPIPSRTTWPTTTAIAVIGRASPVTIEATSDGWVVLTPVGNMGQPLHVVSTSRLQLAPEEVRRWTRALRAPLALPRDTSAKGRTPVRIARLGRGVVRVADNDLVIGTPGAKNFMFQGCYGSNSYWPLSIAELSELSTALDRAATVAEQGSRRPIPPTLGRPYLASELTCSAALMVSNPQPQFPSDMPATQRRYTDVGVRLVVDTSGLVETGSVTVLPGAPPMLERASRELVARWRFRPAVRGGLPVRQVLATAITYDPARPDLPDPSARVPSRPQIPDFGQNDPFFSIDMTDANAHTTFATVDGWVQMRVGTWNTGGAFSGVQEWFSPDSIDSWAQRTLSYLTTDSGSAHPPSAHAAERAVTLSHAMGSAYEVRFIAGAKDSAAVPWARMRGCTGASYANERMNRATVERFVAAARAARAERATPREPGDGAYSRGEVACQASLPDVSMLQEELNIRRQPRGPIPPSMDSRNARAEVLTSFVVGTDGVPKPSTLVVMPGSDQRAVAALRASLDRYRFQPATRAGVRVNALVIRNWSFEPHPRCRDNYDGIDCPKVYSPAP